MRTGMRTRTANRERGWERERALDTVRAIPAALALTTRLNSRNCSIGRLLKECGLRTTSIKIDPYLVTHRARHADRR